MLEKACWTLNFEKRFGCDLHKNCLLSERKRSWLLGEHLLGSNLLCVMPFCICAFLLLGLVSANVADNLGSIQTLPVFPFECYGQCQQVGLCEVVNVQYEHAAKVLRLTSAACSRTSVVCHRTRQAGKLWVQASKVGVLGWLVPSSACSHWRSSLSLQATRGACAREP